MVWRRCLQTTTNGSGFGNIQIFNMGIYKLHQTNAWLATLTIIKTDNIQIIGNLARHINQQFQPTFLIITQENTARSQPTFFSTSLKSLDLFI